MFGSEAKAGLDSEHRFGLKRVRTVDPAFAQAQMITRMEHEPDAAQGNWLRLLSFNIQVGIRTERYSHYLTRGWRHVFPDVERQRNLDRIARVAHHFDLVALQEADAGSLRSGFVNQVEYLAHRAGFKYWYAQRNRDLGMLAQHANGLLARTRPEAIEDHKLPGFIPGRGAILLKYGALEDPLVIVMLHLSLGGGARDRQLAYVRDLIAPYRRVVLMGDLNSHLDDLLNNTPLSETGLISAKPSEHSGHGATYPSWRPAVELDHVLVSPCIEVRHFRVLDSCVSDHRPVAVEIELPSPPLH